MTDLDDYAAMLAPHLSPGFGFREVYDGTRTKRLPPRPLWPRIVRTLQLANELRYAMVNEHGAKGLRINAAYRPDGGAKNSQHKFNRALDLDLLPGDYHLTRAYYEEAVRLWCEHGRVDQVGLGLYCPGDHCQGIRVHIDTGWWCRTWQHGARPGKADALIIAQRLCLTPPTAKDDKGGHDLICDDEGSEVTDE